MLFSEQFACPVHGGISLGEIEPRNFSFNSPHGACPDCTGLGTTMEFDPDLVVPNRWLSIAQGAIVPWVRAPARDSAWYERAARGVASEYGFSLDVPFGDLPPDSARAHPLRQRRREGHRPLQVAKRAHALVRRRVRGGHPEPASGATPATSSDYVREEIERYMAARPCPACKGARLKPEVLAVHGRRALDRRRHPDADPRGAGLVRRPRAWTRPRARRAPLTEREYLIARQILKEIRERLGFLVDVGLDYLTLDRSANTLSGGEAQRIRLATQIGSSLMGVLYILDEPSIGLHQRDNARLIRTLERLRDIGNTLIVVEHDEETMRAADWIVDIGPGAGRARWPHRRRGHDGRHRPRAGIDHRAVPERRARRSRCRTCGATGNGKALVLRGARENNLRT